MALPKFVISLLAVGVLGCLSIDGEDTWKIRPVPKASSSSRFYVLHDSYETYVREQEGVSPFPALRASDIMLKTMGILRDGAGWSGVTLGSLFSRPHATALFIVDGSSTGTLGPLAERAFPVDQTGLSGCTCGDVSAIFDGDNVAHHLSQLFDHRPLTRSVSVNDKAAFAASVDNAVTTQEQLEAVVEALQTDKNFITDYGLAAAADRFDLTDEVDAHFVAELVLMRQTADALKELTAYVTDGAPDVFIFTVSTLRAMEEKYGVGSTKTRTAGHLVQETIQRLTADLVALYDGKILIQALTLEWEYPEYSTSSTELQKAYDIISPFTSLSLEEFVVQLPNVQMDREVTMSERRTLCADLQNALMLFWVKCTQSVQWEDHRAVRSPREVDEQVSPPTFNFTLGGGVVQERTNLFSPIFLIVLFITISLGLSVYAVSWMMWNMDPGRDSIIYRTVGDTNEGLMRY